MTFSKKLMMGTAIGGAIAVGMSTVASAQPALEEIVVTGLKRDESLLDAPVAVSAFTAADIERAGISRPEDFLGQVPNVTFVTSNHEGEFFVNIRGQAGVRFAEGAVAFVIDGVQLATQNEFNGDLFDVEQIEVLKGPQNALYGRNATAGAIIVTTKPPGDEWEGKVQASYGNWNSMKVQAAVGGPLTDNLGIRVAASMTDTDGPFTNEFTGEKVHRWNGHSGRMRLRWEGDNTTADFKIGGSHGTGGGIAFNAQIVGTTVGGVLIDEVNTDRVHEIPFVNDIPGKNKQNKFNASLRVEHEIDNLTLEGSLSYNYIDDQYQAKGLPYADFSNPANDFGVFEAVFGDLTQKWKNRNKAFTAEVRASSEAMDGRLRWQVGGYFQDGETLRVNLNGTFTGADILPNFSINAPDSTNPTVGFDNSEFGVTNYSPFGNIQFDITDNLQLDVAARYEIEERDVVTNTPDIPNPVTGAATYNNCVASTGRAASDCNDSETFEQFQPKVTLSYSLPDELGTLYGSYGKGFKSGGFNLIGSRDILITAAIGAGGDPNLVFVTDAYNKETTDSFELGVKLRMLDGRLALNAAGFYTDVKDAQQFEFFPVGNIQAVSRIDGQEIKGFEVDASFQANDWLTVFAGYGNVDADITELAAQPAFEGNRVPYIARYNAVAGFQVVAPVSDEIDFTARMEYKRTGSMWFDASNLPGSIRGPVDLVDARAGFNGENWRVAIWGRNLNNEKYASETVPLLSIINVPYRAPTRSYGVEASYSF